MGTQQNTPGELRYGQLAWAKVKDDRGHEKERPCIILTPDEQIAAGEQLLVMAVTSTFPDPPPPWHVELPWHPDPRQSGTGLNRRSAAVASWLRLISQEAVLWTAGDVPPKLMREIQRLAILWAKQRMNKDKGQGT